MRGADKAEHARHKTRRALDKLVARGRRGHGSHDEPERTPIELREDALAALAEYTQTIEAEWNGLKFMIDTGDRGIGGRLFTQGRRPEFKILERSLELLRGAGVAIDPEHSVFVDVGANIGTASLAAVYRHGFGRALACEPSPRSRQLLRMSVVRNELEDRVMVAPEAISDHAGEAHLALFADSPGRNRIGDQGAHPDMVAVATATLDSVLARFGIAPEEVGLMWSDVQGHEAEVLRGASSVLARRCPIVFEFWPAALRARGTFEALEEAVAGYETFVDLREATQRKDADAAALATDLRAVTAHIDGLPRPNTHTDLLAF